MVKDHHSFEVIPLGDKGAIMFCRRCGQSYRFVAVAEGEHIHTSWQSIDFIDQHMEPQDAPGQSCTYNPYR